MIVHKINCEICGREISKSNYSKHIKGHKNHPERYNESKERYKLNHTGLVCQFCGKECKNRNSLCNHERLCKENPNRQIIKFNNKGRTAWNKGLTKETDSRVAKYALSNSLSQKERKGRKHTAEEIQKISQSRKKYLLDHPDKVPYLLNHSSKISYPEQYFIDLFDIEKINLRYHKRVGLYELDFYNDSKKLDVEIDGEQHYKDKKMPSHDAIRTEYLESLGWTVYRIRWSEFKKFSFEEKLLIISQIKILLE